MVSAGSQSWYLTDRTAGVPGDANYFIDKGSGAGTSNVSMGTGAHPIWAANEAAAVTCDMSGTWHVHIEFNGITGGETVDANVDIGVISGGSWDWKGWCSVQELTSADSILDVDIDVSDLTIDTGDYLAMDVWQHKGGSGDEEIVVTNGESYVESPNTDPGYPVPELGSLVLFSVGLLALAGYVWQRRRN